MTLISTGLCVLVVTAIGATAATSDGSPDAGDAVESNRTGKSSKPAFLEIIARRDVRQGLEFGRFGDTLLLLARDGQIQRLTLDDDTEVRDLAKPFEPAAAAELERSLRKEFGRKFNVIRTAHYLICHDTDEAFARNTADLAEELYRTFTTYFTSRGFGITKPRFPLVVVLFGTEAEFRAYAAKTPGGPALTQIAGYYSLETNRVAFFNAADSKKYGDTHWHNMTTVIHEATHQIAFNTGLHQRFADNPLWLIEGLAMYFEAPESRGGKLVWSDAGKLNQPRLDRFRAYRRGRKPVESLKSLVSGADRFHSDSGASDAYAESWAFTYFLTAQRPTQYRSYLKTIAAKPALELDAPDRRLEQFQLAFGRDLKMLDASFLKFIDELPSGK